MLGLYLAGRFRGRIIRVLPKTRSTVELPAIRINPAMPQKCPSNHEMICSIFPTIVVTVTVIECLKYSFD